MRLGQAAGIQPGFRNNPRRFIAIAESCSTGRPDGADSAGDASVVDEKGGAVASVANARHPCIGTGDNCEQFFRCMLAAKGRVGPAAGLRVAADGVRSIWTLRPQTLYGDPALRVRRDLPRQRVAKHPERTRRREPLSFEVRIDDRPVHDARVALRREVAFLSKLTNPDGRDTFRLPTDSSPNLLQVTVTSRAAAIHRAELRAD